MCAVFSAEVAGEDRKIIEQKSLSAACVLTSEHTTTLAARYSSSASSPLSNQPPKTPFSCGCGKCTFFSFIESGCPMSISSASSFPYLNVSGLTHKQQDELRGRLRSDSQKIMIRFQKLMSATIKVIQEAMYTTR